MLRGSMFRRVFRGVYVETDVPDSPLVRVEAALAVVDETAFASHASAARVYGVPIPDAARRDVLVLDPDRRRARAGVRCSVNPRPDVRIVHGLRVSAPAQLFVELASLLNLVDLVVVGDNLVRTGRVTSDQLVDYCTLDRASRRGHSKAGRALRTTAGRLAHGDQAPNAPGAGRAAGTQGQHHRRRPNPQPLRRYDLCWPEVKVIVEYDGRHHIEREDTWECPSVTAGRQYSMTTRMADPDRGRKRDLSPSRADRAPSLAAAAPTTTARRTDSSGRCLAPALPESPADQTMLMHDSDAQSAVDAVTTGADARLRRIDAWRTCYRGVKHTELIAIGIGHDDPADFALASVDPVRPEGDETLDLRLLITVGGRGNVEVQPVLPGLRRARVTAPVDLRAAVRRLDRGLLVLVPDQRPAQRVLQKYPTCCVPSVDSAPMTPVFARKLLPGSMTQNSLPSGSASTTCSASGPWPMSRCRPPSSSASPRSPAGPRLTNLSDRSASGSGRSSAPGSGRTRPEPGVIVGNSPKPPS